MMMLTKNGKENFFFFDIEKFNLFEIKKRLYKSD